MLSRAVADRLGMVDEETFGRVRAAVSFAEVALGLFQACDWSGSQGVPAHDGVLLLVRFHGLSERFYVHE